MRGRGRGWVLDVKKEKNLRFHAKAMMDRKINEIEEANCLRLARSSGEKGIMHRVAKKAFAGVTGATKREQIR